MVGLRVVLPTGIHPKMIHTHKLARRLAISRNLAMLTVLVLVAACAGETMAPEGPSTPTTPAAPHTPVGFRVLPGTVTLETDQRIRFRGEMRSRRGHVSLLPLSWEASGGSIDSLGNFAAATPGTYRVVGRGLGRGRTRLQRPDTSVVVVVRRRPGLVHITVTPRAPKLSVNETRIFTAMGRVANGTNVAIGVNWTATGGTIDPAGVYQAGTTVGSYLVIATNTAGTVADTARVRIGPPETPDTIPSPTPDPTPDPTPALARVVLRPATVFLAIAGTHRFAAFGRNTVGDSVPVEVTFRATGGSITPTGLYTAGQTAGTFRVIAAANDLADTAVVTLSRSSGGGTPEPPPGPAPAPVARVGIPLGLSGLLTAGVGASHYTMSLDGYTAGNLLSRLAEARAKNMHVLMNMTGGAHGNYKTNGVFDMAKWRARMNTYNTPAIKDAMAAGVADGTIIGNSVMDEPFVTTAMGVSEEKSWGPPGTMTKARVDEMCGYVKAMFPTLPVGVVHDPDDFEPSKSYRTCDFIVSQYRWSKTKGDVKAFRDAGLALARRDGHAIAFALNILHGGLPGTDCPKYGDDNARGILCPMTAQQVQEFSRVLGPAGCALNMWRYEREYFTRSDIQRAIQDVAESLAPLPRKPCLRS